MIPFIFNENRFSFFVADHLLVGQLCTNPKSDRNLLSCQSDTMSNERDWRCAAVQLMLSTNPSYNIRTITSTLKMQIWTVQSAQGDENKVPSYGYGLWCGFKWGPHHATSHLRSRLESQHQSVPGCAEECGDLLVQSGGRWQTLGVAAGLGAGPQVQRDPGLASEGVLRLCTLLSLASPPPPSCSFSSPVDWGCRIHWLFLCREVSPPPLSQWVLWIWHKTVWWWGSSNAGALENAEYPFIAIAPRSTCLEW